MNSRTKASWLYILLVVVLFVGTTTACVSEDQVRQWVDQLVQDLTQAIEQWAREQIEQMIEDLKRELEKAWEEFKADLRNRFYPPPPTITAPPDGTTVPDLSITIEGEGVAGMEVSLYRDGKFFRQGQVNNEGRWRMERVALNAGRSTAFTAKITSGVLPSRSSNRVVVTSTGTEPGVTLPRVIPELPEGLDRHAWMLRLAMIAIEEGGNTFYATDREAHLKALEAGLRAAQKDDPTHRYIDPRYNFSFGWHLVSYVVPKAASREQVMAALIQAVKDTVTAEGVQRILIEEIRESYQELEVYETITEGGISREFRYIQIGFRRQTIYEYFDAGTWTKFRTALGSHLISTLVGATGEKYAREILAFVFALWGAADGDSQAQQYYDLAVMAWNHEGRWDDWQRNRLDWVEKLSFKTNQEWGLYYLGRSIYHLQALADPYYTIPPYKPQEDLFARVARYAAQQWAKERAAQELGRVIGGGAGLSPYIKVLAIFETLGALLDARQVNDVHRPNFERFVNGGLYETPVPDIYRENGATNTRAGLPFRGPGDFMLHADASHVPPQVWERGKVSHNVNLVDLLDDAGQEFFINHRFSDMRQVGRAVGERAARFVQPSGFARSDMRVPEGEMILDNSFFVREVYGARLLDSLPESFWQVTEGQQVQVTFLDGTVVRGTVAHNPGQFVEIEYGDPTLKVEFPHVALVRYMVLEEIQCTAGPCGDFNWRSLELYTLKDDAGHLYAAFDPAAGGAPKLDPNYRKGVVHSVVGVTGWAGPDPGRPYPEKHGAADIAYDSLLQGTLVTMLALNRFAEEAPNYGRPEPIVVGPDDLAVTLGSPARLHLYDAEGRHVGPNATGGVDLDIPGARYYQTTSPEQTVIFVPDAGPATNYYVQVEGTGTGKMDIETFVGDPRSSTVSHGAYLDISVTPNTRAELDLRPTDPVPLALDVDGDGTFETQHEPAEHAVLRVYETEESALSVVLAAVRTVGTRPKVVGAAGSVVFVLLIVTLLWRWRRRKGGPPTPPGVRFCPQCGAPVARPTSRFCGKCGTRLQ